MNLRKLALLAVTILSLSSVLIADTPPPIQILQLKAGAANGVINATGGALQSVAPGTSGNCLKSNGTAWISSSSCGGGGAATWGSITGTLGDQTDLATALAGKVSTSAVIDILHGGTGQTTQNSALNALLPTQTGNSGKVLQTDGTNASWAAVAGTGTVTNVTSTDGSIDITNPTTTPNLSLHFPISAPGGSASAPSFRFDSDTGMYSTGDGTLNFSTNSTLALLINNNQQATFSANVTATDFVYPAKTANTFLAGPVSGGPAIPGFRTIQNGDISDDDLPWPLTAPGGGASTGYCFDSDTCVHSTSDGLMSFSTNNVDRITLQNNGDIEMTGTLNFTGNATFTGNISAANLPPVGSANTLARFNNSGTLDSSLWGINPDTMELGMIHSIGSAITGDFAQLYVQHNLPTGGVSGTARAIFNSLQGNDPVGALNGWQLDVGVPVTGDMNLATLNSPNSITVGGNATGLGVNIDTPITGGLTMVAVNGGASVSTGTDFNGLFMNTGPASVGGNANMFGASYYGTAVTGDFSLFNAGTQNSLTISGNYRGIQGHNNADVSQFAQLISVSQGGIVTKGLDVLSANISADVGDGTGVNLVGLNMTTANTITVDGGLFGLALSNQATVTNGQIFGANINNNASHEGMTGFTLNNSGTMSGNNTVTGIDINNSGTGYRFTGQSITNSANQSEEIRGVQYNLSSGNSRTATGMDLQMGGTYTDDARAIRINASGATVTNGRFQTLDISGNGVVGIQSNFTPFSSFNVDIGNNITTTATVASGSPLTGTDTFIQFFQSNLIADDNISTGPFGINTTMTGMVSQVSVGSGKTIPFMRSALLGTSVPSGSGGTITRHAALQLLGLPSFGGSVTNTDRTGLLIEPILGQDFCSGATDCWGVYVDDDASDNYLNRLALGTSNKKTDTNVKLEIHDGHIKTTQTSAPTATPDANAGTGATCTVSGTDTNGSVILTTGTLTWAAGAQCAVTFDSAFNSAPVCVFSPTNGNAAMAALNSYVTKTASDLTFNFVNPDIASTEYKWDYHCYETN